LYPTSGEGQVGGCPHSATGQNTSDLRIIKAVQSETTHEFDRFSVGDACGFTAASTLDRCSGDFATLPFHSHVHVVLTCRQYNALDGSAQQSLVVAWRRVRCSPNALYIARHVINATAFELTELVGRPLQLQLGLTASLLDCSERFVPLAFQVGRDEAIGRVDCLVVCSGAVRFVLSMLDSLLPVPSDDLLLLSDALQRQESDFDSSGLDHVEKHLDDQLLDPSSAKHLTEEAAASLAPQYSTNELPESSLALARVSH
jgi:hypothetical protein